MISEFFPQFVQYVPNQYARALIVLLVLFLVFRILLELAERIFNKIAAKTPTEVDNLLIQKLSVPLTMLSFLLALRLAIEEISLTDGFAFILMRIVYSLIVIAVSYMIFVFVEVALVHAWRHVAKKSKIHVNESVTNLADSTLRIVLVMLAIIYILQIWGVEVLPVLGALGIAGIAVALALQPVLSNIFSGVSIIMDRSIKVGDWIILDDGSWGIIHKIGIRSTRVQTSDNEMVIIPNTRLADSRIRNVSLPEPTVRKTISFGVAMGSNVEKVKRVVLSELKKVSFIVKAPEPSVHFVEIGASSLKFKAFFYIDNYEHSYEALDEANTRIYTSLQKAGIDLA